MTEKVMTFAEVSERTRVPVNTLKLWRIHGKGPKSFKIGRNVRYLDTDVDAWLHEQYERSSDAAA